MESGDSGSRSSIHLHSGVAISEHHQRQRLSPHQQPHLQQPRAPTPPTAFQPQRDHLDRKYRDQPAMATATVLAPSSHYPSQSTPYLSYARHQPGSGLSQPPNGAGNMISSEHRRPSDEREQSSRQSLPSISEVISGARPEQYASAQPNIPSGSSLPSPFAPTSRQYAESENHSPQSLHSASNYPSRQENLPAFVDSPRPPFNGQRGLPPVSDRRATPPVQSEHPAQPSLVDSHQSSEHHASNGSYAHPAAALPASHSYPMGHLPPGQVPLPNYPISPRHAVQPPPPGQYEPLGHTVRHEEAEYIHRARFDHGPGRHFETWNYQDSLSRIGSFSRTIFNFAEAYGRIAQEQHGSHPIPERLPTEREVIDMLANVDLIKRSLEQVKDAVQASIQNERAREGTKAKGMYDDERSDVPMYDNGVKPQYTMTEIKKRRGRAAPPGRCHSCNRIDTPEWRRGPDGARTLCNACGLHYAKIERKRLLENRPSRPKLEDRS